MLFSLIFALSAIASSASAEPASSASGNTLADAEKAYVAGDWKTAAAGFDAACPGLEGIKRNECALWGILALSQTGNTADFARAGSRLDSLIAVTPTSESLHSDLYMTKAQFELYLKKNSSAFTSWKRAYETATPRQYAVLSQVCESIREVYRTDSVAAACESVKQAKDSAKVTTVTSSAKAVSTETSSSSEASSSSVTISSGSAAATVPEKDKAKATDAAEPAWVLQLGAFSLEENAQMLVNKLKKEHIDAQISVRANSNGKSLYLVRTGAFDTREAAMDFGGKRLSPIKQTFQPVKLH